jgi:hypothetical protein
VRKLILGNNEDSSSKDGTKKRIYLIKFAMGSTNLHEDWSPDHGVPVTNDNITINSTQTGINNDHVIPSVNESVDANNIDSKDIDRPSYYEDFVDFVKENLKEICRLEKQRPNIDALFWLQGHSDASGRAEMGNNYGKNFVKFIKKLRLDLKEFYDVNFEKSVLNDNMKVVVSQLTWLRREKSKADKIFYKKLQKINLQLEEVLKIEKVDDHTKSSTHTSASINEQITVTTNNSMMVPNSIFARLSLEQESELSFHPDGHSDTDGLLKLGENMAQYLLSMNSRP